MSDNEQSVIHYHGSPPSIIDSSDGYVDVTTDTAISFNMPSWASFISPERQAFILLKILSGRKLTQQEKESLPEIMNRVGLIIGEGPSKVLLKHILEDEMIFKDVDLLERCIEKLQEDMDVPLITSIPYANNDDDGEADNPYSSWYDTSTGQTYVVGQDNSDSKIETSTDNRGIEKSETSGTIGEQ